MFVKRRKFEITLQMLVLAALFHSGMPSTMFSATGNFKLNITPDESLGAYSDIGCKYFNIAVYIDDFGVIPLDEGICSGWFTIPSVDSSCEERDAYFTEFEKYNFSAEDARHGVDINTINVLIAGDKAFVEWETVSQGSGLHVEHEYRVYQKGVHRPLISRNIKSFAKSGWFSRVNEQLTVREFTNEFISLQTDSHYYDFKGVKAPLHFWDEKSDGYVYDATLQSNVLYTFSDDSSVDARDARITYLSEHLVLKTEIAKSIGVSVSDLLNAENGLQIMLDEDRYNRLFSPVTNDIARSLFELMKVNVP